MTSFQRFKRDIRSKAGSSQGKSSAFKSEQKKDNKINDLVSFSSPTITFNISQNNPYSVFKLKITNLTGYKIHFKIRCNNSKCYTATPYEEVISDKQTIQIKFQLKANIRDLNSNFNDKFQIMWGKIPYQPTQQTSLTQSKIFPVQIKQRDFNQDYINQYNQLKLKSATKNYPNNEPNNSISYPDKNVNNYSTLLTRNNIILVSIIAFILGFIFT